MNRLSIELIAAIVIAVAAYFTGDYITARHLNATHDAEISKIGETNSKTLADAVTKARKDEQTAAAGMAALDKQKYEELQNEKNAADKLVNSLQSGERKLRDRFTCTSTSGSVPSTGTSTGLDTGSGNGGLQKEDGIFLIRFAERADQAAVKLQACQEILKSDRGVK